MMWKDIGINPYGIIVQENEYGIRRFKTTDGWKVEDNESIEVCRINNKDEIIVAAKAMSNLTISKYYEHNPFIYSIIWFTPKGIPTKINKNTIDKVKENKKAIILKKHIENELGKRVLFLWMNHVKWNDELPKWNYTIKMRSPTLLRGIQIGLAKLIKERYKEDLWTELGLLSSSDSSIWILPTEKRKIYASKIDENQSVPFATLLDKMPIFATKKQKTKGTFNQSYITPNITNNNEEEIFDIYTSADVKKLLWITERSISHYGINSLISWKEWYSLPNTEGIVVFENKNIEKEYQFFDILNSNKGIERHEITIENSNSVIIYIISKSELKLKQTITLKDWVGDQPRIEKETKKMREDEFGRVPYRALSKVSKPVGMIPKRLEESIHNALLDLQRKYGDIDKLIAKSMGISKKDIGNYISAEQVDAVALFMDAFSRKQDAILADETGFGKGRVLASLVKIGLRKGKTVLFLTENSQLFSDFYRDLTDVYGEEDIKNIVPTMLHGNAKIINTKSELIAKISRGSKSYNAMMDKKYFENGETKLIMSTYSQINKENKEKSNVKVEWLKERLKSNPEGCWLILDESHNAAGDSNVNNNLESLLPYSDGCLFSSATYAKTENNLSVYKRATNLPEWLYILSNNAIAHDEGEMREALTTSMAKKGNFIRREHKPIDPPEVKWVEMKAEEDMALSTFSIFWRKAHKAVSTREKLMGGFYGESWAKIGGYLSRSVKEFSFLVKVDYHISAITESLKAGRKPFLALESTFESAFRSVLENDLEDESADEEEAELNIIKDIESNEEDNEKKIVSPKAKKKKVSLNGIIIDNLPTWKERLALILNKTLNIEEFKENNENPEDLEHIIELQNDALNELEKLPDWDLMPIEKILRGVKANGYNVGELSGRMLSYEITEDGKYKIIPLNKPNRVELVNNINDGSIDFAVITLAGCTGISVHAGKKFKDQKQRELFEGDIAVNTSKRIQFWGRVRRKDQVCEPLFSRWALNILSEKRTQAREDKKKEKLAAHVGMKQDFEDISWISKEGEDIVEEWALDRKPFAAQIGVSKPIEGNAFGRVDRALLRSIILPLIEQEGLLDRLERGLSLMKDVAQKERNIGQIKRSRKIRENWLLGHPTRNSEDPTNKLVLPRISYVERVYEKNQSVKYEYLAKYITENNWKEVDGEIVLEKWKNAWLIESSNGNVLNPDFRNEVWNWVSARLPLCKKGNEIKLTRPGESDITSAVILGFDYPECIGKKEGSSNWALSQVAMKVWMVGEENYSLIPLIRLFKDPNFKIFNSKINMNLFKQETLPFIGVSIEGNPILAAYWGRIWKIGKPILVNDDDEGLIWIWSLPKIFQWNVMKKLPKIALNIKQIYNFLCFNNKKDIEQKLIAIMKEGRFIFAKNNGYAVQIEVDHDTFKEEISGWANPRNKKLFNNLTYKGRTSDKRNCVSFNINYKFIFNIFSSMEKNGIIWKIENCDEEWYYESSKNIMDSAINEGEKILNPNKKKSNMPNMQKRK